MVRKRGIDSNFWTTTRDTQYRGSQVLLWCHL